MRFLLESLGIFFLFLIVLVLVLILAIAAIVFLMFSSIPLVNAIDAQTKEYIEQSIRAIASHWAAHELAIRASPRMLGGESSAQISIVLDQCQHLLGQLTDYRGAQGSLQGLPLTSKFRFLLRLTRKKPELEASEGLLLGDYQAQAEFSKGLANFEIQCLKQQEDWSILSLQITATYQDEAGEIRTKTFSIGERKTIQTLVEENKKRMELEKLVKY